LGKPKRPILLAGLDMWPQETNHNPDGWYFSLAQACQSWYVHFDDKDGDLDIFFPNSQPHVPKIS
jgi:hypothetical protein